MADNLSNIVSATLAVYYLALKEAWRGFRKNLKMPLFHVLLIIPLSFLFQNPSLSFVFSNMAGGFIAGLILATLIAAYLATVQAAVKNDSLRFNEIWNETLSMFNPVISFLFLIFIASFLINMTIGAAFPMLVVLLRVAIAVFLNPAPEEIIHRGGSGLDVVRESFEFVRENFLEWFIPWFLCLLLFLAPLMGASNIVFLMFTVDPISMIRSAFSIFNINDLLGNPFRLLSIVVFFYLIYFVFIFRACLYYKLATSNRRKRVYQYRSGSIS